MIRVKNLTLNYHDSEYPALKRINLQINDGDFLLLTGPTGSGKTSLLMAIAGLVPNFSGGKVVGSIEINGTEILGSKPQDLASLIGYVSQQPEGSFVAETVVEELAFGLEQLAFSAKQMRKSIDEIADKLSLADLLDKRVTELSGGEQQRVAIAAALVAGQRILLLDEPTSALDSQMGAAVADILRELNQQHGVTIVVSEHRVENLIEHANSMAQINIDGSLRMVAKTAAAELLSSKLHWQIEPPLGPSKLTAICGPNGSGKSTLLWQMQERLDAVMVPQRATDLLFLQSVAAEFKESDEFAKAATGSTSKIFESLVGRVNPHLHPRDLSAGQQLALALAVQLVRDEPVLILDEPTRGLDQKARLQLAKQLRTVQNAGKSIVLATHDLHFAESIADRILAITSGQLSKPLEVAGHSFTGSSRWSGGQSD